MKKLKERRADAIAVGDKRYRTGVPCKWGHTADRYSFNGTCCVCGEEQARASKEKMRAIRAKVESAK